MERNCRAVGFGIVFKRLSFLFVWLEFLRFAQDDKTFYFERFISPCTKHEPDPDFYKVKNPGHAQKMEFVS